MLSQRNVRMHGWWSIRRSLTTIAISFAAITLPVLSLTPVASASPKSVPSGMPPIPNPVIISPGVLSSGVTGGSITVPLSNAAQVKVELAQLNLPSRVRTQLESTPVSATLSYSRVQTASDWNYVYGITGSCQDILGVTVNSFSAYEGMSGNGGEVTNLSTPNMYYSDTLGWGPDSGYPNSTNPNVYPNGESVQNMRFSIGYGPAGEHSTYYYREYVYPDGSWTPYSVITCLGVGS